MAHKERGPGEGGQQPRQSAMLDVTQAVKAAQTALAPGDVLEYTSGARKVVAKNDKGAVGYVSISQGGKVGAGEMEEETARVDAGRIAVVRRLAESDPVLKANAGLDILGRLQAASMQLHVTFDSPGGVQIPIRADKEGNIVGFGGYSGAELGPVNEGELLTFRVRGTLKEERSAKTGKVDGYRLCDLELDRRTLAFESEEFSVGFKVPSLQRVIASIEAANRQAKGPK